LLILPCVSQILPMGLPTDSATSGAALSAVAPGY
jgi:hypothetical protein